MTGPELTFVEKAGGAGGRSSNDKHLSIVMAHGHPILTADIGLAAAMARAVLTP